MPDSKIQDLPESTTGPGSSVTVGSFGGVTKKITFTNLAAALALLITGLVAGTTVGGKQICLADGTNCPPTGVSQEWDDTGASLTPNTSTRGLIVYGGATSSNLTATGTTSLQGVSFTSGTGTSIQATSGTIATLGFGSATSSDLFSTILRTTSFSANSTGATSTNFYWSGTASGTTLSVNGQSVCLANGTNCPTALTGITSISFTTGDFTINGGRASSTLEIMGGSLWTLAQYGGSSATNVPTSTAYYLGTNSTIISGMLFDATNTQYGFTDQIHLGDGCATTTIPVTFYWTTATGTGSVVWGIRAKAVAEGEYDDSAWGSWVYATGTFSNSYYRMSTSTLTNLIPASWDSCRDTLYFQVVRNQESGDTFGGGALLEKVVLEYGKKSLTD